MVVEELIAKLGLRATGLNEAKKFIKALEEAKKAVKGFNSDVKGGFFSRSTGLDRLAKDFERAAAAAKAFRREVERPMRSPRGGYGPGGGRPGGPGRARREGLAAVEAGLFGGRGSAAVGGYVAGRMASRGRAIPRRGRGGPDIPVEAALSGAGFSARAGVAAAGAYMGGRAVSSSVRSSMDFERSMIEVTKATDATAAERAMYEERIMRLARDTGQNKQELAGMLAQAGFSGRPKDELMRFTEYGAGASRAWGTTPEATGEALAQLGNIYEANQTEIERIGDQINTMADKSASKETDLLEILRRVGGTGRTAGMSPGDILGFGAGLKERGVQTEIAASGIESYLNFFKLGEEFSKDAGDGIKALGTTSDKLRAAFVKAPTATALDFLEKINNLKDPRKRAEVLNNIFGKERQDDVERMASSVDKIRKNIAMINDPRNYIGSTMRQLADQLKNDVSKIDQATQQIDVLKKRAGDPIKRLLGAGAEKLNKGLDAVEAGLTQTSVDPDTSDAKLRELNGLPPLISGDQFGDRFGTGTMSVGLTRASMQHRTANGLPSFTRLPGGKYAMDYQKAPEAYYPPTLGATPGSSFGLGGAKGTGWMQQSMQQATQNITNNTNVGNDQRTQTASVTVNATGLDEVASQVRAQVQGALASMGPSIAKGNATPTTGLTLTGP